MGIGSGGKVPQFTLRPQPGVSLVLVLVLITGVLLSMSFFSKMDGTGTFKHKGVLTLIITALLSICLAIVATSKMWFSHLWKVNSTHARHRKHTQHHPMVKEGKLRNES